MKWQYINIKLASFPSYDWLPHLKPNEWKKITIEIQVCVKRKKNYWISKCAIDQNQNNKYNENKIK